MKKKMILLVTVLMLLSSCSNGNGEPDTNGNGDNNADTKEVIKIGAIASLSGALQDYGEQMEKGFTLGLEYATNGTLEVAGKKIEVIWEDTTNVPDVARERTMKLLEQDKVDIVTGYTSSGDAGASLDLFEEFKTVVVVEPAAADAIISADLWNRYMFRTGRTSGQDALAMSSIILNTKPDAKVAVFVPDSTYGHGMADPFLAALEGTDVTVTQVEYAPVDATDFSPYFLRIKDSNPDYLYVSWAGANNPWRQLLELGLHNEGITIAAGASELAQLKGMKDLATLGTIGYSVYYPTVPDNEVNDWLVERHNEVYGSNPDYFTSGGMAAAMAIVKALEESNGDTDPEVLIPIMEGMEFDTPTGRRWFREEDHQAMTEIFEIEYTEGDDHAIPVYVRTIPHEDVEPPITNGR